MPRDIYAAHLISETAKLWQWVLIKHSLQKVVC